MQKWAIRKTGNMSTSIRYRPTWTAASAGSELRTLAFAMAACFSLDQLWERRARATVQSSEHLAEECRARNT